MGGISLVLALGLASAACSAPVGEEGSVPDLASDAIDEQDQGTTYNGWGQQVWMDVDMCRAVDSYFAHDLQRTSGDATRGGGGCLVRATTSTCTSDASCITLAQAQSGSQAWGYCYSSKCYIRDDSQANACVLNANRSPGAIGKSYPGAEYYDVLGCMTKTAGPNTSCGCTTATCGSNYTSLYMRTINNFKSYYYSDNCPP